MAEELDVKIFSSIMSKIGKVEKKSLGVLKLSELPEIIEKIQIVGGDSDDFQHEPPAIIIEKIGEQISKIIVKCPCGRHSELICEYEDEENI